jgi:phospholipid-translocating ATPase
MIFRRCSIGGKIYSGDSASPESTNSEVKAQMETNKKVPKSSDIRPSSVLSSTATGSGGKSANDEATVPKPLEEDGVNLSKKVTIHFSDATLKEDLEDAISADPSSENASHARLLNGFFTVLALCHTVLTSVDPKTGEIEYKAQSPDEAALVQAAADVGFIFRGREREVLRLQTPFSEEAEEYELLNILEFTSARKRMSVVLRKMDAEDERLFLLTKGADSVIFERLKPGGDELKVITEMHLDEFASEGFRTLTLAYKIIQGEFILYVYGTAERIADSFSFVSRGGV